MPRRPITTKPFDPRPFRFQRWLKSSDLPRRPALHCNWCGQKVKGRRQSWCGPDCIHEFRVRAHGGYATGLVRQRDRGICCLCGFDALAASAFLTGFTTMIMDLHGISYQRGSVPDEQWNQWPEGGHPRELLKGLREAARLHETVLIPTALQFGLTASPYRLLTLATKSYARQHYSRALWEADHVVPVQQGGGCCDLSGFQTLCLLCHKSKTAQHAATRATKRQADKQAAEPQGRLF